MPVFIPSKIIHASYRFIIVSAFAPLTACAKAIAVAQHSLTDSRLQMSPALGCNGMFGTTLSDDGGALFVIGHIANYAYLFV